MSHEGTDSDISFQGVKDRLKMFEQNRKAYVHPARKPLPSIPVENNELPPPIVRPVPKTSLEIIQKEDSFSKNMKQQPRSDVSSVRIQNRGGNLKPNIPPRSPPAKGDKQTSQFSNPLPEIPVRQDSQVTIAKPQTRIVVSSSDTQTSKAQTTFPVQAPVIKMPPPSSVKTPIIKQPVKFTIQIPIQKMPPLPKDFPPVQTSMVVLPSHSKEVLSPVQAPRVVLPPPPVEVISPVKAPTIAYPPPPKEVIAPVKAPMTAYPPPPKEVISPVKAPTIAYPPPPKEVISPVKAPTIAYPPPPKEVISSVKPPMIAYPPPPKEHSSPEQASKITLPPPPEEVISTAQGPKVALPPSVNEAISSTISPKTKVILPLVEVQITSTVPEMELTSSNVLIIPESNIKLPVLRPPPAKLVPLSKEKLNHPPPPPPPPAKVSDKMPPKNEMDTNDLSESGLPALPPPPPISKQSKKASVLINWVKNANPEVHNDVKNAKSNAQNNDNKAPPVVAPPPTLEIMKTKERDPSPETSMHNRSSANSSNLSEEAVEETYDQDDDFSNQPWFFDVTREEATQLMKDNPKKGTYLMRPSQDDQYVLMLRIESNEIKKFKIQKYNSGWILGDPSNLKKVHPNISSLMEFYIEHGVKFGKTNFMLKYSIIKK